MFYHFFLLFLKSKFATFLVAKFTRTIKIYNGWNWRDFDYCSYINIFLIL